MLGHSSRFYSADVVALFENQDDADEAVLQLRLAGVSDSHIGYYTQNPTRGLIELISHDRRFAGSLVGGVIGAALGVLAAQFLNSGSIVFDSVSDSFGLAVTLGTFGGLFAGFLGWWIGTGIERRSVQAPAIDSHIGAFILAVSAGAFRDRARALIHQHGGHELPAGSIKTRQIVV